MCRRFLCPLILLASLTVANPCAQDLKPGYQNGPQLLVMLTEFNPWALVVGWDPPKFVLYESGQVIYKKNGKYVSAKLAPAEVTAFIGGLRLDSLGKVKNSYITSRATDQPTNVLLVRTGDSAYRKISVYGSVRRLDTEPGEELPLPTELSAALHQILSYENAHSLVWVPEYIEVFIWPFEYAKGEPADWPKQWPGITDRKTVKRDDAYSLFIPGSQNEELRKFIASLEPTQAVRIDNKKWAVSARFIFPHEAQPIDK